MMLPGAAARFSFFGSSISQLISGRLPGLHPPALAPALTKIFHIPGK